EFSRLMCAGARSARVAVLAARRRAAATVADLRTGTPLGTGVGRVGLWRLAPVIGLVNVRVAGVAGDPRRVGECEGGARAADQQPAGDEAGRCGEAHTRAHVVTTSKASLVST